MILSYSHRQQRQQQSHVKMRMVSRLAVLSSLLFQYIMHARIQIPISMESHLQLHVQNLAIHAMTVDKKPQPTLNVKTFKASKLYVVLFPQIIAYFFLILVKYRLQVCARNHAICAKYKSFSLKKSWNETKKLD